MNIVNKLTLRQMKLNRKRTIITMVGTIISAAMITAVALLGLCFMDLVRRDNIANHGEWHVIYEGINRSQLETIREDKETKSAMMSRDLGYTYLEGSENNNKPYLFIKEYNKEAYENFPIELSEGRLPENPGEIVLSEAVYSNANVNYSIGDVLTLTIGQRYPTEKTEETEGMEAMQQEYSLQWKEDKVAEFLTEDMTKTYTIVGIIKRPSWEYTWSPGYTTLSYVDENYVAPEESFDTYVTMKHVNNKLFGYVDRLAAESKISTYGFNDELLRYYGAIKDDAVRGMLFNLSAIIMGIIVIGSISLIYNAFAISVSERSRHLGMMSSVGATKKQKRNSVFFEGAVIGAISIPIGIAAGHLGLAITFLCINPILLKALEVSVGLRLAVYPSAILAAFLISAGTILISTYIPARRASNISAIDAIRQTSDVKVTRRQVKTWKLTRKIFGIEGELGLKNLKRNKKRYKATVFSLVISMILFLVVSSFTQDMKKALYLAQDGLNFDIMAEVNGETMEQEETIVNKITALEDISKKSVVTSLDVSTWIPENKIANYLEDHKASLLENGNYPYGVTLNVLSDDILKAYCKEVGIDERLMTDPLQSNAIIIDNIKYVDYSEEKYVEARAVKSSIGDTLELSWQKPDSEDKVALEPLRVAALTGTLPMGLMPHGEYANFHIILSKQTFDKITAGRNVSEGIKTQVYFTSKDPMRLQENIESVQASVGNSKLDLFNVYTYRQTEEQIVLLMSVFTYAFIILITAICAANILNTVSTSISLRKREFAMLKSVGITPKGFNIMLNYESIFYGIKSLLYGLPASFAVMYLIHVTLTKKFEFAFTLPVKSLIIVIISVFLMVSTAMLYASRKVKKDNIIDALKQEII